MVSINTLQALDEQSAAVQEDAPPFLLRQPGTAEGGTLGPDMLVRDRAGGIEVLPIIHPDRQRPKFQFAKAWHHFSNFRENKEETSEVFGVFEALPWRGVIERASRFLSEERGRSIFGSEPFLPEILDDHQSLRRLPKNSFAHEYCDYMEREQLTAEGLVQATTACRGDSQRLDDGVEWYNDRLRDTHDLLHILTGFGRDTLGEQCVLAYVYKQRPSPGHVTVAYAGALLMLGKMKSRAPVLRAVMEAQRNGKSCMTIAEQSVRELLRMSSEEVRKYLNIGSERWYSRAQQVWREEGIDPMAVLGKQGTG
jgi:ubiquinone biosynthesis protein COQ4